MMSEDVAPYAAGSYRVERVPLTPMVRITRGRDGQYVECTLDVLDRVIDLANGAEPAGESLKVIGGGDGRIVFWSLRLLIGLCRNTIPLEIGTEAFRINIEAIERELTAMDKAALDAAGG